MKSKIFVGEGFEKMDRITKINMLYHFIRACDNMELGTQATIEMMVLLNEES